MTDAEQTFEGVETGDRLDGRRFVLGLYVTLVAFAAGMGVVLSVVLTDEASAVALFGVIDLPPTALGFALYGTVTVGIALGIPLLAILYISGGDGE